MRTTFSLAAALVAAACTTVAALAQTGNGAPSGSHYNLNIIGVSHEKNVNMDQAAGNVIFVGLGSSGGKNGAVTVTSKILLTEGPFAVLDKNGTDGQASFQLPQDSTGAYTIWARALGKPGGTATLTTCADTLGGITGTADICSTQNEVFLRMKGKSSFRDVTTALTTITFTLDVALFPTLAACLGVSTTGTVTVNLFNPCLQDFLWKYDNTGLRLLQLRFYAT